MSELLETIREACLTDEINLTLASKAHVNGSPQELNEIRHGEAVPITFSDLYPEKLSILGQAGRELAEASLIFNSGRLRLATSRLRLSRKAGPSDFVPKESDYLELATEINAIIASGASEVLTYTRAHLCTEIPLAIGSELIKRFYANADVDTIRRNNDDQVNRRFITDIYIFAKMARDIAISDS